MSDSEDDEDNVPRLTSLATSTHPLASENLTAEIANEFRDTTERVTDDPTFRAHVSEIEGGRSANYFPNNEFVRQASAHPELDPNPNTENVLPTVPVPNALSDDMKAWSEIVAASLNAQNLETVALRRPLVHSIAQSNVTAVMNPLFLSPFFFLFIKLLILTFLSPAANRRKTFH